MKLSSTADDFEDFWAAYPRKVGKGAAKRSWDKCVDRMKISPSVMIDGAKRYAAAKAGSDIQYVAHPGTWLNGQRWLDEDAAAEPETAQYQSDRAAVEWLDRNQRARALRDRLIRQTRETHRERIAEAARRLSCSEAELWSCLAPGSDGVEARAWDAAVADVFCGKHAPGALTIEKTHWLSARDRHETRLGIVRAKRNSGFTAPEISDIDEPVHSKREMDDDDYSAAPAGMA